jgi:hypothetical protein
MSRRKLAYPAMDHANISGRGDPCARRIRQAPSDANPSAPTTKKGDLSAFRAEPRSKSVSMTPPAAPPTALGYRNHWPVSWLAASSLSAFPEALASSGLMARGNRSQLRGQLRFRTIVLTAFPFHPGLTRGTNDN